MYGFNRFIATNQVKGTMICVICRCELTDYTTHQLPECGHYFHANCICTWFRSGQTECPLCRDKGVSCDDDRYTSRKHRIAYFKRCVNTRSVPEVVKDMVFKLKKQEVLKKELRQKWKQMRSSEEKRTVRELEADTSKLKKRIQACTTTIQELEQEIGDIPVVPITLCTRKTIYSDE